MLLAGGGGLLVYLAKHPAETTSTSETAVMKESQQKKAPVDEPKQAPLADTGQKPPSESIDPAELAEQEALAEKELANFMSYKKQLESQGVSEWGGDRYSEMIALGQQADALLIKNEFEAATEKYKAAIVVADSLSKEVETILQQLLAQASAALEEGDGETAQKKFSLALMIDPDNRIALKNLDRAKKVDAVRELLSSGEQHENNNNLSFALADFQEALRLDPESKKAQTGLERIKTLIKDQEFQQLISDGLAAYHNNDLRLARAKLLTARSFKPDSREVQEALNQVDTAIRLSRIERLRQQAQAAEVSEDWQKALKAYLDILEIDANLQFASRGKARALEQIKIAKRIAFYLAKPQVLEDDQQLENAVWLIQEVQTVKPAGPRLAAQLDKLRQLVQEAQTPVRIIIISDSLTNIAVYKVGKLGRFSERTLDLRPGTYTIVGDRDGYQDVRQKLVVKPGQKPIRITITCKVKI
jgi:hypothetical protein